MLSISVPASRLSQLNTARSSAVFSDCGTYRYLLTRRFEQGTGTCLFVMLNPSTADGIHDDPTVRRCAAFARAWGYSELRVVNLFGLRAADPRELQSAVDPVGPQSDAILREEMTGSDIVVAAWGNHGRLMHRSAAVRRLLVDLGIAASCLGLNATGEPVHPLYVPSGASLVSL